MSQCNSIKGDIARVLSDCLKNDESHGNENTASLQCGNRASQCTKEQVLTEGHPCRISKDRCTKNACCTTAVTNGFIDPNWNTLPTEKDLMTRCQNSQTVDQEPCFEVMVQCVQENSAQAGGCCQCEPGWYGATCNRPLCYPTCQQGYCVAPNQCRCNQGWKGDGCQHPVCEPDCQPSNGICVEPGVGE